MTAYASKIIKYSEISAINKDEIDRTSAQWRMVNSLLLATVARFGFVVISYGCKVPAGIFIPSMAIGATFGRMVGIIVKALVKFV